MVKFFKKSSDILYDFSAIKHHKKPWRSYLSLKYSDCSEHFCMFFLMCLGYFCFTEFYIVMFNMSEYI